MLSAVRLMACVALMVSAFSAPVHAASSEKDKHCSLAKWTAIAGVGVTFFTLFIVGVQDHLQRKAVAKLRATIEELQTNLAALSARVDAIPFNDFVRQADRKIAEVRRYLDEDADRHRRTILRDIDGLRSETVRLAQELERRQVHLDSVATLVSSVRDNNHDAFVEKLVDTKNEIERSLVDLRNERILLNQQITQVTNNVNDINARVDLQKNAVKNAEEAIVKVKDNAVVVQSQSQEMQKFVAGALEEATVARKNISRAQTDFSNLNTEVKTVLRKMEEIASVAKNEKDSAEKQLKHVYALLDDVRSRATTLATVTVQEETRVRELLDRSSRVSAAQATYARSVLESAQHVLSEVFGIAVTSDAPAYRSAYRKFALKNHPDKGGDVAAFQAVDGLYKLINDNALFGAKTVDGRVQDDLAHKMREVEATRSSIIK